MEESLRPDRPLQYVSGLTDFLIEEYHKRLGIYTQDASLLCKFWKDYVSVYYKEKKAETLRKKYMYNSLYPPSVDTPLSALGVGDIRNLLDSGLGPNAMTSFGRQKYKRGKQ